MSLDKLPPDARPREKLLSQGAATLADAELLALVLRTGLAGRPVLQLAQALLDEFGGFAGLLRMETRQLAKVKGLGPAKLAVMAAVLEIARRSLAEPLRAQRVMDSTETVHTYLRLQLEGLRREVFAVLFLDVRQRLITMETLFHGSLTETSIYPREVVKRALELGAAAVILAHNHPSGDATPSPADQRVTRLLANALALVEVRVLDHVIVGAGQAVSMADRGLMS